MKNLVIALDVDRLSDAFDLIDILSPQINHFKIGIAPFVNFGNELLHKLISLKKHIFLDLKFHDIPNTVKNVSKIASEKGISMIDVHCFGGIKMMQAAVEGVREANVPEIKKPLILGITVLTSMEADDLHDIGFKSTTPTQKVLELAKLAKQAGLDGVVASAKEVKMIKEHLGKDFIVVCPGIRPDWSIEKGDQKRIATPRQAILDGADYLVVGRPIIHAPDPLEAANRIIHEIEETVSWKLTLNRGDKQWHN